MSHDLFEIYRRRVQAALKTLSAKGEIPKPSNPAAASRRPAAFALEPPRDSRHGDMALNAAMALAKEAGENPRALAEKIRPALQKMEGVEKAEIAGPGFLNLTLKNEIWQSEIPKILALKDSYGSSARGEGRRVLIEYVSANPTGPLHIGHARGAVFGDALALLMEKTGCAITREYYVNDAGAQADTLAASVWTRCRQSLGETIALKEGLYPGDYLVPVAEEILKKHGGDRLTAMKDEPRRALLREESIRAMMELIRADLKDLGVSHDCFIHESALVRRGAVKKAVGILEKKGFVHEGTLPPPKGGKGKESADWTPHRHLLFLASRFGDSSDRPLQKKDGSWTYFASDIAYHHDKIARGFDEVVNVWGADHAGYAPRLRAAFEAFGSGADFHVKLCHMVRVLKDGSPVKMSKRAGGFIALRDVLKETGRDAFRFQMLTRKNDAPLDFDMKKVLEQANENPIFYVQYAHARICSVFRRAEEAGLTEEEEREADFALLAHQSETSLIKMLARFPRQVALASSMREPHRIAFYLHDLAALFHALWNVGKDAPAQRFLLENRNDEERALTLARLALLRASKIVLAEGLRILGVRAVEEMR